MTTNLEQTNQILELDINTRKELWNNLFLFVDFSRMKKEYPNMWNKDYRLLPLPNSYQKTKEKLTKYFQKLDKKIEQLINSFNPWFKSNIYPVLKSDNGAVVLLFRCNRLFDNKIMGETSSLFLDLLIFEKDYLAQVEVKKVWNNIKKAGYFPNNQEKYQNSLETDLEKLAENKANLNISWTVYQKWTNIIEDYGNDQGKSIWASVYNLLKDWEKGKLGTSQWETKFKEFADKRDKLFELGSTNLDGQPFFQLGEIKKDSKQLGLIVATQNRKAFNLANPLVFVINFHQKYHRVYNIANHNYINPRNLYVNLQLKEDWVWKDYPWVMNSLGSLNSVNHPVYHSRNLPE